jgi:hypothetical protein
MHILAIPEDFSDETSKLFGMFSPAFRCRAFTVAEVDVILSSVGTIKICQAVPASPLPDSSAISVPKGVSSSRCQSDRA